MTRALCIVGLILSLFGAGCADSFDPASLITRVRITGTRLLITGETERAWLRAEDDADLRISVVGPTGRPDLQWNAIVCVPAESSFGIPFCAEDSPVIACPNCLAGSSMATEEPVLEFTVPDTATLDDAKELIVLGAFCAEGAPIDGEALANFIAGEDRDTLNPCADPNDQGEFLTLSIPIEQVGEGSNDHPTIDSISLEGDLWTADAAADDPLTPCTSMGLPEVVSGSSALDLVLDLNASSFEQFSTCPPDACEATEALEISWHVTSGELGASFTAVQHTAPLSINAWKPPTNVTNAGGLLTRFNIVARDERGGVDWINRALCVVPD